MHNLATRKVATIDIKLYYTIIILLKLYILLIFTVFSFSIISYWNELMQLC